MGTPQPRDSDFIGYDQHEDNFPETTKTSFVYGVEGCNQSPAETVSI